MGKPPTSLALSLPAPNKAASLLCCSQDAQSALHGVGYSRCFQGLGRGRRRRPHTADGHPWSGQGRRAHTVCRCLGAEQVQADGSTLPEGDVGGTVLRGPWLVSCSVGSRTLRDPSLASGTMPNSLHMSSYTWTLSKGSTSRPRLKLGPTARKMVFMSVTLL